MKNIKYVLIFILTFMFFNSCFNNLKAIDYPLDIDVVLIQFNYDITNYSEDAYSIVPGYNSLVIQNEWINDGGISKNDKIAYIKSQTNRKIKVKFWHNQNQSVSYNFVIGNSVAAGTSFGYAPYTSVSFPSNNNGYSELKTYQLSGTVPNSVGKRYVQFAWYCTNYAFNLGNTGNHYYYTLLAAPQAPMATPWVPVLEYSCNWANGQTTSSGALSALINGLYINSGLVYNGYQSHYKYEPSPQQKLFFDLTDFLYDWNVADCQDCSMLLSILSSSISASLVQTRRIQGSFNTKNILPIGYSSWSTVGWNFHHIGWLNNVFDACLKLNQNSPRIPINENIDNPYKSDLYYNGTWSPQNAFYLGQTDPYFNLPTEVR